MLGRSGVSGASHLYWLSAHCSSMGKNLARWELMIFIRG